MWSPDGEYIAFERSGEDRCRFQFLPHNVSGLYTMKSDGTDVRRITRTFRWRGEWSPDGRLAFVTDGSLYTVRADGRDKSRVYRLPAESEGSPIHNHSWSPDGRLAFVGLQEDERGTLRRAIYTAEADGSGLASVYGPRQQESELSVSSNLAWSPDGGRIAFLSRVGGAVKLYTMASDGSDLRETAGSLGIGAKHGSVSWSPDGSRILVAKDKVLHVGNADGSNLRRVGLGSRSAWSPDGSRIAAVTFEEDGSRALLYTMAPDGSDVRFLVARRSGYLQGLGPEERDSIPDIASCSAGVVVPDPEANLGLVRDCETLVEITDVVRLVGTDLNWSASTPIADWQGVTLGDPLAVDDNSGSAEPLMPLRIRGLSLTKYEQLGIDPTQLKRLPGLRSLAVQLSGPIPLELGNLTDLQELSIHGSEDPIPTWLANLENLQKLSIHGSVGPIPPGLANLENLQELRLSGDRVGGPIPPELANLENLHKLSIDSSVGPIPPWLANLENLQELRLSGAGVSGPIPPELGRLSGLRILDLHGSNVSGSIPAELGGLTALEILDLHGSNVSGSIPAELGSLTALKILDIRQTNIGGPIPAELGALPALEEMRVEGSYLSGCIPRGLVGKVQGRPRHEQYVWKELDRCDQ